MGDASHNNDRQAFFAELRARLRAIVPQLKAEVATVGAMGISVAAVGMIANDATLYPQVVTGLLGTFIGNRISAWRNAPKEQIAADLEANQDNPELQGFFQELDLAGLFQEINAKLDGISDQVSDVSIKADEILKKIEILTPAELAFQTLHQLPSAPENFVGRQEEIDDLCSAIRANAGAGIPSAIISSIEGMGGVGKTGLALVVAHRLIADFPDAQLIVELRANGKEPVTTAGAREQILHAFDPKLDLPDDETKLTNLYRSTLASQRGLIIFDDARDDAHIRPLLPPAGWAVLITSRNTLATGKPVRLESLPRADAVTLLREWAARITEAQAGDLAEACGDLPVALNLIGADLKRYRTRSVDAFTRELRANPAGHFDLDNIFGHSFNRLPPRLQNALSALSVMPASFMRISGEAIIDQPDHPDLLDDLIALNWLAYDEKTARFSWHDLLRDFIARQTPQGTVQAAAFRHAQHFTQVAYESQRLYEAGNDSVVQEVALFERERPHLEAAFAFLTSDGAGDDESAKATALNDLMDAVLYIGDLLASTPASASSGSKPSATPA